MKIPKITSVSVKLGSMVMIIFLLLIVAIHTALYMLFVRFYTNDQINELLQRSSSYSAVLSDHFEETTISHVLSLESSTDNLLLILDASGNRLGASDNLSVLSPDYLDKIITHGNEEHGSVLASDWKNQDYFVAQSAIQVDQQAVGKVIMLTSTDTIRTAVRTLGVTNLSVAAIAILISGALIFVTSNKVVQPLLRIIRTTQRISDGKHDWELTPKGTDEIAQLSRSINQMSANIQYYKHQRNQFLADISHELRTPLTYIKGYSEVLANDVVENEQDKKRYLALLHSQSIQLQRLVQDLFELANLEQGAFSFEFKRTSIEKVILNTLDLMSESIKKLGIELTYDPSPVSLYVMGDERRLQQVMINLLENAKKYTPEKGAIHISTFADEERCAIQVTDTGSGIPEHDLPHIWERLYRVDKSRSRATGGAGLGLAISKEIINLHHGEITVESIEDAGTAFTIRLGKIT